MTRRELIESIRQAAQPVYGPREAASIARLVTEKLYGLTRADCALDPDAELPTPRLPLNLSSKVRICKARDGAGRGVYSGVNDEPGDEHNAADVCLSREIASARPIQYILGAADFADLELAVGEGVLIPRPETEELVRWITDEHNAADARFSRETTILDIGTGSGAIAIALAKSLSEASVTAIDISPEALKYARLNNEKYSAGVTFLEADILDPALDLTPPTLGRPDCDPAPGLTPPPSVGHDGDPEPRLAPDGSQLSTKFDVIVSNPPYIPAAERQQMADNVTKYEPATALFVPDADPLVFYRAIARFARRSLNSGGALYFEIHENLADEVAELLTAEGFRDIEIRNDINSKPRMIKCVG